MKYIDNDKNKGILYNWDLVEKEYKKLNCPKGFFNLCDTDIKNSSWIIAMSPRATSGKTTNVLLYGLIMYKLYGTKTAYVRSHDFMIEKKLTGDMFDVILENNYINKIFDAKWNSVFYFGGKFYLTLIDTETGEVIEKDDTPFLRLFSIQSYQKYKSTVNDYFLDFVVMDEFVSTHYLQDEFEHLCDLLATLFRLRLSGRVILLSNTVDKYSQYFKELCIFDDIIKMEFGDSKTIVSPLGTRVNVNMLKMGVPQKKMRGEQVRKLFGFPNPKLASITGSSTWAIKNYLHIPKEINYENEITIDRYIVFNGNYVRIRLINDDVRGICVLFTKATKLYDDAYIYTIDELIESKYKYKLGNTQIDKMLWCWVVNNRAYYDTNETGYIVERYLNACKDL